MSSHRQTNRSTISLHGTQNKDDQTHLRMSYVPSHTSFVMEAENICHYPHTNSIVMFHPDHPDIEIHHFETTSFF